MFSGFRTTQVQGKKVDKVVEQFVAAGWFMPVPCPYALLADDVRGVGRPQIV